MKIIKLCVQILLGFFAITAIFAALNAWAILSWRAMETVWLFYPGFMAFTCAYLFSKYYRRPGSGIFFAFCLIVPATLASYYCALPWGDFFFRPLTIILAAIFSVLGEAMNRWEKQSPN